jgi:6-phosphogluconolactonase
VSATVSRLVVVPDAPALARVAAQQVLAEAQASIAARREFRIALAGGSTPRAAYEILAEAPERDAGWSYWHVFFGDERCVPAGAPESNARMASVAWLSHVPIPETSVHRVPTEAGSPEEVAAAYERDLRTSFRRAAGGVPVFDMVLLGLGPDGHTASLFPGSPTLVERTRWVVADPVPRQGTRRVTLTLPVLDAARRVLFLVSGAEKAAVLKAVLAGREEHPAARVRAASVTFLADRAASE